MALAIATPQTLHKPRAHTNGDDCDDGRAELALGGAATGCWQQQITFDDGGHYAA